MLCNIASTIGLVFAGLFIGYAMAIGLALGIISFLQVRGKPVPVLLQKLARDLK